MGVAPGGTGLASSNIALRLTPRGEGTAYMAAIGMCNAAAAGIAQLLGGLLADWFATRELRVMLTWHTPWSDVAFTPIHLWHWEFFFVLPAVTGLCALHALGTVQKGEGSARQGLVRDLMMEAARGLRSFSSAAGPRVATGFPVGRLVGRRPARMLATARHGS